MTTDPPTWQLILTAARGLVERGRSPFSRAELLAAVRSLDASREPTTVSTVLQGMTANATGGPRSACGTPMRRVDRGMLVLQEDEPGPAPVPPQELTATSPPSEPGRGVPDVLLVGCVKTKGADPAPAKDLYQSPMFARRRRYAEASGRPWFILSAEHGLVEPSAILEPYDLYLAGEPAGYRVAWGQWVVARLQRRLGKLDGLRMEIHASEAYVDAVRDLLEAAGTEVIAPLQGLRQGEQLSWYDSKPEPRSAADVSPLPAAEARPQSPVDDVDRLVRRLLDEPSALTPDELVRKDRASLMTPGLYSWWVDETGARALSEGLDHPVRAGLIYAGQAGATRWPSGKRSTNTLWGRLVEMHLGNKESFSTFRRTLAAVLAPVLELVRIDDPALSVWMATHLRVIPVPLMDSDRLGVVEGQVLDRLDPPLNLQGMPSTPLREQVRRLRLHRGAS